jgi:hypothetical protein
LIATHLQQSGGANDGVCPGGQLAQRTFEQSVTVVSTGTHLQQSGGLSAGVCPSGQVAQRTLLQFPLAAF